ncbi:MAG: HAD family hydrolase [Actinobacteria bacterium]|nr:MAG: HAD family hydrolase [Actinomycetota bacterium]
MMIQKKLPERLYDAYIFDMDGTIYLGDELLPGAKRLIEELRRRHIPVRFLSNNPTKDPAEYVAKLEKLGIPTPQEEIASTIVTLVKWLKQHHLGKKVFPIAERPLIRALEEAGIPMSEDPKEIDIVVSSYDRTFEYRKLQIAFDAIWFYQRAILVATNPDRYCPFPGGRGEPDCAAITAAIEACTGHHVDVTIGKPNPITLHETLAGLNVELSNCIMIGDRLGTDIRMAVDAGMPSAMPLTGDSTLDDVDNLPVEQRPTFILDRVDQLVPASLWDDLGWSAL